MGTSYCYSISSYVFLLLAIFYSQTAASDFAASPLIGPEHKLFMHLFTDYTPDSRPVKNASHKVVVKFDLSLNQLLDLDEKNQILTTSVWIYEEWTDEMLKWSPSDYDDQQAIMIPATNIWLPDIFIFNTANANMDGFVNVNGSKVSIHYDGNVKWMVPLMISSVCAVDVTYFPYDRQACTIKFGSWIYDTEQLEIFTESTQPDLEHYVMNSEYDLRHVSISQGMLAGSCCPGEGYHSVVEMKIELGRKSLYYDYIVIAPTIMLCVLTLASFLLPCDRGEKMAIGLTVFLTLYVLQLRIADNVPDTNSTPILGVFLLIVMTFNCVSLIMATIVMNIKKRGDDNPCPDVPSWLFWTCHNVFGRVVCTRYLWKDQIQYPAMFSTGSDLHARVNDKNTGVVAEAINLQDIENNESRAITPVVRQGGQSKSLAKQGNAQNRESSKDQLEDKRSASIKQPQKHASEVKPTVPTRKQVMSPVLSTNQSLPSTSSNKQSGSVQSNKATHSKNPSNDIYNTQLLSGTKLTEMRLRRPKNVPQDSGTNIPNIQELSQGVSDENNSEFGDSISKSYLMKRRWFFVAEVVDKFLFIVYLILLTCSIFTVLFLIPVYFRNDK